MGNFGYQSTCGILLCRREEVLSAPRVLLVLKRSFTVSLSSLDVFFVSGWCVVLCLFGFFLLFFVLVEDIQSFAFSPVLQQLEISWPTMPRARSALALKKNGSNGTVACKKKNLREQTKPFWFAGTFDLFVLAWKQLRLLASLAFRKSVFGLKALNVSQFFSLVDFLWQSFLLKTH